MFRHLRLLFLLAQLARLSLAEGTAGAPGPAGGSGDAGAGGTGSAGDAGGTGSSSAATGTTGTGGDAGAGTGTAAGTGQEGAGDGQPQNVADLPPWAQKVIADARAGEADKRTKLTAAEKARTDALRGLAAALGVDVTDTPPDPAALQGQVQTLTGERDGLQGQVRSLTTRLAAWPAATAAGADPVALMDSATFLATVDQLDPGAADFAGKLTAAIKAAVTANPKLRSTGQAPGRGGADFAAGSGNGTPATSLEDAITKRLTSSTT